MRLQAAELSFVKKPRQEGEHQYHQSQHNQGTVSRKVEILHTEFRVFDLHLTIVRRRFIWTVISPDHFYLRL
jgi:hypothetical protein